MSEEQVTTAVDHEVRGCLDCPAAEWEYATCKLDPDDRGIGMGSGGDDYLPHPPWCPLAAAPITLRIKKR